MSPAPARLTFSIVWLDDYGDELGRQEIRRPDLTAAIIAAANLLRKARGPFGGPARGFYVRSARLPERGARMTPSPDTRKRWRFFLEHAGYATPPGRAACALSLARAEQLLDTAEGLEVARFELEPDDFPYDPGDVCTEDEAGEKFRAGEWTGPYVATLLINAEGLDEPYPVADYDGTSIGGVVFGPADTADPYARVIRAELAAECADELLQAIGDARDELADDVDATPAERVWAITGASR